MALLHTLQDTLIGPATDSSLWTPATAGSASLSNGNGITTIFPASTTSSTIGKITSATTYSLIGSYGFLQATEVPLSTTSADGEIRLFIDTNNWLRWVYEGGTLFAQYMVATVKSTPNSFAYDPNVHRWWRIREVGGTVFWDTSVDGLTWANKASVANPITLTALSVLVAGTGTAVDSSPGRFTSRYFNTPISEGLYNHLRVGNGMSRSEVAN